MPSRCSNGADINERDEESKFTALHEAIDLGFMADYAELGMVDFLLDHGAEKDIFAHLWPGEYDQAKASWKRRACRPQRTPDFNDPG